MKLHFVTVPIHGSAAAEAELNQFLGSHRVIAVDRQLIADGARSAWAVCVAYLEGRTSVAEVPGKKGRIDYREVLAPADFQVFARLREIRKHLAERDAVPPYAVFTNEQLAEMIRGRARTAAARGTATRGTAARPTATRTIRATRTTTWGFVLSERTSWPERRLLTRPRSRPGHVAPANRKGAPVWK